LVLLECRRDKLAMPLVVVTVAKQQANPEEFPTILVEAPFDAVPHGAKGVGELPMDVGAPAVIAAIADATGVWIADLPASPERIVAALSGVAGVAPPRAGASEPAVAGGAGR